MDRRKFLKGALMFGFGFSGGLRVLASLLPEKAVCAVKPGSYPGRTRVLRERDIIKEGKWLG